MMLTNCFLKPLVVIVSSFLLIGQVNTLAAESTFNTENKLVTCSEPLPFFALDENSKPSKKDVKNLCTCIWKKFPTNGWEREISKKMRDGTIKSDKEKLQESVFSDPFREALISCGGEKYFARSLKPTLKNLVFVNKLTVKQIFNTNHKTWLKQSKHSRKLKNAFPHCPNDPPWHTPICMDHKMFASFIYPYYSEGHTDKPVGVAIHYSFKEPGLINSKGFEDILNKIKKDLLPEYSLKGKFTSDPYPRLNFQISEN